MEGKASAMVWNCRSKLTPTAVRDPMMASAINAARAAYSIAVTPESFFARHRDIRFGVFILRPPDVLY
jgi:hypothetical protein